jgi:hypothetical protein
MAVMMACAATAASAAQSPLDEWFARATGLPQPQSAPHMSAPDYLCGKTFKTMCKDRGAYQENAGMLIFWALIKYDRAHQIGLARSGTDQEGFSLFSAPPPPPGITVPNADLSQYHTGRGLHLGSTYAQVLALYGGPAKHGSHFVVSYIGADTVQFQGKPESQPMEATLVIDNGRVSAITINVELWEP